MNEGWAVVGEPWRMVFPLLMLERDVCEALSPGPAVMGRAQPMGLAVVIVIPGGREGFLEEGTLSWALELSRRGCSSNTRHSLSEGTERVSD